MGHWYDTEGNPAYQIKGANGKIRDTTLRDARKYNYAPSVTTIMAGAAKPGLDTYLQTQLLDACLSVGTPMFDGESINDWKAKVIRLSKEHSKKAATNGTAIHDALEQYYLTGKIKTGNSPMIKTHQMVDEIEGIVIMENVYYSWKEALTPVIEHLKEVFGDIKWQPERSFTHRLGFGGKVDMSFSCDDYAIVLDFKTKDTNDIKKMIAYDEHGMQTAAYAVGFDIPHARRYNLFISTKVPGLINLTESTNFNRDWGMFEALLKLWQLKNNYVPGS